MVELRDEVSQVRSVRETRRQKLRAQEAGEKPHGKQYDKDDSFDPLDDDDVDIHPGVYAYFKDSADHPRHSGTETSSSSGTSSGIVRQYGQ